MNQCRETALHAAVLHTQATTEQYRRHSFGSRQRRSLRECPLQNVHGRSLNALRIQLTLEPGTQHPGTHQHGDNQSIVMAHRVLLTCPCGLSQRTACTAHPLTPPPCSVVSMCCQTQLYASLSAPSRDDAGRLGGSGG